MKMNIFEKKALYSFGCPNHEATVDRLQMIAAIAPDYETQKFFLGLAIKLDTDDAKHWYQRFVHTLREEMESYYDAELTMKLAELSTYDMEGEYGEANEI